VLAEARRLCDVHKLAWESGAVTEELVAQRAVELSPVAAVMGGMLGNEAVKVVTGKDEPMNNLFVFDAMNGAGGRLFTL
jgi:ubiquitin-like 1-activating enzyme E1 A